MNFEDEEYVRVYKKKTRTVKRIGWQGRTVLWHMIIEADSAGWIEIGDEDEAEVIADLTEVDIEVVRVGLAALSSRGVTEHHGSSLLIVRHVEAQEAKRSDRVRAKEYRARKLAEKNAASRGVTVRHESSRLSLSPSLSDQNTHQDLKVPTEQHRTLARELGVDVESEFARFKAHAKGKAREMADPSALFELWILDDAKKTKRTESRPRGVRDTDDGEAQRARQRAIGNAQMGRHGEAAKQKVKQLRGRALTDFAETLVAKEIAHARRILPPLQLVEA